MRRTIDSIVQVSARLLVMFFTGAAALSALAIALTQIGPVRSWAVENGLRALNKQLIGRVQIGEITGNLITGFSIQDVQVVAADSSRLVTAARIDISYQFRPILKEKTINVAVTVHNPVVTLIRDGADSLWNFTKIARPGPPDTTKGEFPYTINIRSLEIIDARIVMNDMTERREGTPTGQDVDFARLDLQDVNISARARYSATDKWIDLQHLGFYLQRPDIRVIDLAGRISADSTGATAEGLRIETTRTLLDVDARLDSVNFFAANLKGPEAWKRAPVRVDLNAERISTLELRRFLPVLSFLGGTPRVRMLAEGTYGDIRIRSLDLGLTSSHVLLSGRLRNLNRPDSLYIDATITDSKLQYRDIPIYLPGLAIPDLAYLGDVAVHRAEFVGYPQAFNAAIDARTAIGSARGGIWLDLRPHIPRYSTDIALVHANPAPVLKNPEFAGDFTGHLIAAGSGFSLPELNTAFRLVSESSTISGRNYRMLIAAGTLSQNGLIRMDTLMAAWGPKGTPSEETVLKHTPDDVAAFKGENITRLIAARVQLSPQEQAIFTGNPSVAAGGTFDIRNRNLPSYDGVVQARRFALSDIIPGASAARLTFSASGHGSNFDLERMELEATLQMTEAELPDGKRIAPFGAQVKLASGTTPGDRALELRSDIADVDLHGAWNFNTVVNGMIEALGGVGDYIGRKTAYREEDPFAMGGAPFGASINATYSLTVKNLAPLEIFMNGRRIAADGEISGEISGTSQLFSITAAGAFTRLSYAQDDMTLRLHATQIQAEFRNIAPGRIDDITTMSLSIRSDSVAQYNGTTFNAPRLNLSLEEGAFRVNGATGINGSISLGVNGMINTADAAGYRVQLDTVRVGMAGGIRWRNIGMVRALIRDDAVEVDTLAMQRNNAEIVEVRGSMSGNTFRDVQVNVTQGRLQDFAQFFTGSSAYLQLRSIGGWLRNVKLRLRGTMDSPVIEAVAAIDSLSYAGGFIGDLTTTLSYADKNLTGVVKLDEVAFPIDDAVQSRVEIERLRGRLNLSIAALNQLVPDPMQLGPIAEASDPAKQLEQIGRLQREARALRTIRGKDSTLWSRTAEARSRFDGQLSQLRSLVASEMTRNSPVAQNPSAVITVKSFPVDLAFAARPERVLNGRPVAIEARTDSLPIAFLASFFSGIQIRSGAANMRFNVTGIFPNLRYSGEGSVFKARALVEGNNIYYNANAKISFRDQTLAIEELSVRNDVADLPGGMATVIGTIKFDGFQLKDLNLIARTDQLLVLSEATQAVNETIYGPLVIASGLRPLRFSGTLKRPRLEGDVDVVRGNLRMERGGSAAAASVSPASYVDLAEWRRRTDSDNVYGPDLLQSGRDTLAADSSTNGSQPTTPGSLDEDFVRVQERIARVKVTRSTDEQSLADLLELNLDVAIRGRLFLLMDFSPIEQLRAVLANDEQKINVRRGADGKLDLRGSVQVLPGSKYDFIKAFDATGDLTFAGDMARTKLAIVAEHNGRRLRPNNAGLQTYQVQVTIRGTIEKPDIALSYNVEGETSEASNQAERNRNAISLLVFGRTADELANAGIGDVGSDLSSSVLGSSTSSIASRLLTDVLSGGTDFIRSIDIDLSGRAASARLNVVSQFGDFIVRAGGQVTDPLNNGSFTIEAPFSALTDLEWLRNFAFQVEAARNTGEGSTSTAVSSEPTQVLRFSVPFRKVW